MAANLPPCPQSLKSIQHYLKIAAEHEQRDIVVAYWCRVYALQTALKIDRKSDDARLLLVALMDWLEKIKKACGDNDAISNDVAAQAHIENYALKLFTSADTQDRAGVFNKNIMKSFYTAGMLMDVLLTFGEHTDEIARNCKYAKWKAAYLHNCLKTGETPIPGPMDSENDPNSEMNINSGPPPNIGFQMPNSNYSSGNDSNPATNFDPYAPQPTPPAAPAPAEAPAPVPAPVPAPAPRPTVTPPTTYYPPAEISPGNSGGKVDPTLISKAQKYCKFAGSALNYDDIPEAINNLEKALQLLKTGQDS